MTYCCSVLVLFSCLVWLVHAQSGTVCPRISGKPSCVCDHPNGTIDLTALANPSGSPPRFKDLKDPNDWLYSFNPCYTYSQEDCKNVYICQSKEGTASEFDVATGNEGIYIDLQDTRGSVYLYYTGAGQRTVHVYLHCFQNETGEPRVTTLGDSTQLYHYIFNVYSCQVCPGGCVGGSEAGIVGIILISLFIFGVGMYFIVGAIIMKVKYDATGTDLIPNKNFWLELPHLLKGGVIFTFGPCINFVRRKGRYSKI